MDDSSYVTSLQKFQDALYRVFGSLNMPFNREVFCIIESSLEYEVLYFADCLCSYSYSHYSYHSQQCNVH